MKRIYLLLLVVSISYGQTCEEKYEGILKGKSEDFKSYLLDGCKKDPSKDFTRYFDNFLKNELSSDTLNCMGDARILDDSLKEAVSYYTTSASLGNLKAQENLGILYKQMKHSTDKYEFPSQKLLEEYMKISTNDFVLYKHIKEIQKVQARQKVDEIFLKSFELYSNQCLRDISFDYEKIFYKLGKLEIAENLGFGKRYRKWIYIQGMVLQEVKKKLNYADKHFRKLSRNSISIHVDKIDDKKLDTKYMNKIYNEVENERLLRQKN